MEKHFNKQSKEWILWELASKSDVEDENAAIGCCQCEASVVAKKAMKAGWVRSFWVGGTEPQGDPDPNAPSRHICPSCQNTIGIDIEDGYDESITPAASGRKNRPSSRRNRGRSGSRSGGQRSGSDKNGN